MGAGARFLPGPTDGFAALTTRSPASVGAGPDRGQSAPRQHRGWPRGCQCMRIPGSPEASVRRRPRPGLLQRMARRGRGTWLVLLAARFLQWGFPQTGAEGRGCDTVLSGGRGCVLLEAVERRILLRIRDRDGLHEGNGELGTLVQARSDSASAGASTRVESVVETTFSRGSDGEPSTPTGALVGFGEGLGFRCRGRPLILGVGPDKLAGGDLDPGGRGCDGRLGTRPGGFPSSAPDAPGLRHGTGWPWLRSRDFGRAAGLQGCRGPGVRTGTRRAGGPVRVVGAIPLAGAAAGAFSARRVMGPGDDEDQDHRGHVDRDQPGRYRSNDPARQAHQHGHDHDTRRLSQVRAAVAEVRGCVGVMVGADLLGPPGCGSGPGSGCARCRAQGGSVLLAALEVIPIIAVGSRSVPLGHSGSLRAISGGGRANSCL